MLDIVTENADLSGLDAEKPGDDRKQRALAGAVQAKQGGKASSGNREAHIVERLARTVAVANPLDHQRHGSGRIVRTGCRLASDGNVGFHHWFAIVMPHGSSPT